MKYVAVDVMMAKDFGKRFVVAFPEDIVHAVMAEALRQAIKTQWPNVLSIKTSSAGNMNVVARSTSGKSESLSLKADPMAAATFNNQDYSGNLL